MDKKVPKQLILEATSRCNLKCKYCPNTCADAYPEGDMDLDLFKHAAGICKEEMPDTVVIPWMNGEPFLHPRYLDMVMHLSSLGLRFYVTTNLTIWNDELVRFLLSDASTCYQLIVSMDGLPRTGSIEKARPGTNEEHLLKNVARLLKLKGEMDSRKDFAVKICERGQDWEEIEDYIQYWLQDTEIDYVCVGKPLKDENEVSMRKYPCQYFDRNFMVIRWDGKLVPCAYNDKVANGGMLSYGRISMETRSLLAEYNNDYITRLRWDQDNGMFHEPCATCAFAYTGHGFRGEVEFNKSRVEETVFFHQDYYNMFFSLKRKWKKPEYYLDGR